ncbi:MAG: BON domain-containing protein [Lutibacter sp.]|uniref:BON domain-containing protein n=1 Tax=Lutibacter sp. TaxID=1925666 RepID=UPI00299E8F60|nr:BON domain-containing protein [Lutibacter sp.]MDX1829006.1 BON domain-containing protein [Lutibacter sp.]
MKTDAEIKDNVLNELTWKPNIDETKIEVNVENGIVTLNGIVDSYTKKIEVEKAIKSVKGVKVVTMNIKVIHGLDCKKTDEEITRAVVKNIKTKQDIEPAQVKKRITKAFVHSANIKAKNIIILVDGHTVTLKGTVHSIAEKEDAQKATYQTPGVYDVRNELKVQYYPEYA